MQNTKRTMYNSFQIQEEHIQTLQEHIHYQERTLSNNKRTIYNSFQIQEEHKRTLQEHNQSPRRYIKYYLLLYTILDSKSLASQQFLSRAAARSNSILMFYTYFIPYFIIELSLRQERTHKRHSTYHKKKHTIIFTIPRRNTQNPTLHKKNTIEYHKNTINRQEEH